MGIEKMVKREEMDITRELNGLKKGDHHPLTNGRDKTPDTRMKVKEINMNTIYVKNEDNAASLDVAAPTSAMVKGGTEIRLFLTVIFLLAAFAFPAFLLVFNLIKGIATSDHLKAASSLAAMIFTLLPLYGTWRYSFGFVNALFMTCRGLFTPFLFIYAVAPADFVVNNLELSFAIGCTFSVLLAYYRSLCRPPPRGN